MATYPRTRSGAQRAARDARKGMKLYTVRQVAGRFTGYEDKQLYVEHTVDHRQALTGAWMICGSLSVEGLVLREGPVYTSPPADMREIGTPGKQVAGPDAKKVAEKAGWFSRKPAKAGR